MSYILRMSTRLIHAQAMPMRLGSAGLSRSSRLISRTSLAYKAPRIHNFRCFASSDREKSWSEIADEAKDLAKDLASKLGKSLTKAVDKAKEAIQAEEPSPSRRVEPRRSKKQREDLIPTPDFGGSLLGKVMGKAVGGMLNKIASELQEAQEQVAEAQRRVSMIIESNKKLKDRLGGSVQVYPAVSQSSMTSSINGRSVRQVTLILPVVGARGQQATAEATFKEDREGAVDEVVVKVRLPDGEVINLEDNGGGSSFKTIDVEWKELN